MMSKDLKSDIDRIAKAGWLLDELLDILPPFLRAPNDSELAMALDVVTKRLEAAEEYAASAMHERELIGHTSMDTVIAALREFPDADTSRLWVPVNDALAHVDQAKTNIVQKVRKYITPREVDIAERLVASGPKAAHVSASECQELTEAVVSLNDEISASVRNS